MFAYVCIVIVVVAVDVVVVVLVLVLVVLVVGGAVVVSFLPYVVSFRPVAPLLHRAPLLHHARYFPWWYTATAPRPASANAVLEYVNTIWEQQHNEQQQLLAPWASCSP